jgi:ComF family protein
MAILSSDQVKMTSLLEKIVAIIAPHRCIVCGNYDNALCAACSDNVLRLEAPVCVLCGRPTPDWRTCAMCHSSLSYVWPLASYQGEVKALLHAYKFEHVRALAEPLAACLDTALPYLDSSWTVVAIPTAPARVRQRGYDQAVLLARELAKKRGLAYRQLLVRQTAARQVGATRKTRQKQAAELFAARTTQGRVLLVDDVCTTGATLQAAALALKKAGATEVAAVVVAWKV